MFSQQGTKTVHKSRIPLFASAFIISLGYVVVQLDVTIVNVALPTLSHVFNADVSVLQWIPDAYVIVFAALLLAAGGLGDKYGNRTVNLAGIALFLLASVLCACSSSVESMIFARIAQGVGAALIVPSSLALLSAVCGDNPVQRTRAIGWWSAIGGIISAAGPFIGGLVLEHLSWQVIFLINVPICLAGGVLTVLFIETPTAHRGQNIDTKGILLFVIASFTMIYSMIAFGKNFALTHSELIFFALSLLALFTLTRHIQTNDRAFLPKSLFKNSIFSLSLLLAAMMNFAFYGSIFLLTLYFQDYRGFSPLMTGLALLTFTIIALANALSSSLSARLGVRRTLILGLLIATANYLILAVLTHVNADYITFVCFLFLMPIGGGIATPTLITTFLHHAPPGKTATASAAINAMRQTGAAMGIALLGLLVTGSHFPIGVGATAGFALAALVMLSAAVIAGRLA
ncbi:MFS transporter [Rouxiella badensis]|uniref:MFS transporter n=1 Tax=Rouxiella badensis TaxID=1646377 RepID=A0A1X0WHL2_9GAMM|nr:MFS transporter [Rouxiella badensis]ORJ26234.1 MFS transporter [Rouxiella badensis]WAT03487.1 MFS transporter [Rouxiella badensis]